MKKQTKKAIRHTGRSFGRIIGTIGKIFGTLLLIFITTGAIMAVFFVMFVTRDLEVDLDVNLEDFQQAENSFLLYQDAGSGEWIQFETLHGIENRVRVSYDEIPDSMIQALLAIEDKRFFEHNGVDWKRTFGAFGNLFLGSGGSAYGGSTITQQLIKNITGEKEVTVQRKVQEILRALEFEKHTTKEQILEEYLNTCYFGEGSWGVKTAAMTYFGKELDELTVAESACIIGITNSPTRYNPFINPDKNKKRQQTILDEMYDQGKLTEAEYNAASKQKLVFSRDHRPSEKSNQSYFADEVFNDVVADLMEARGVSKLFAQQMVLSGGYRIYTTMDKNIQDIMDDVFTNEENFPVTKGSEKPQSAMLLMDPYTGHVLGMAGGRGEKQENLSFNRATQAERPPGSSIKPISVYAPAMEYNLITPYAVVDDTPLRKEGSRAYPRNSTNGGRYTGRMTIANAVKNSTNTVAVRVVDMMTPQRSFEFATENMHISTLIEKKVVGKTVWSDIDLGPLALGGFTSGAKVIDMTAAYCVFPNEGFYNKPITYTRVEDYKGNVILENEPAPERAIKEKTAWYMNNMLQDVVKGGTGSKAKFEDMHIAGKTGTTTNDYDRWFAGYTPYYCAVAWFGYDQPKKITLETSTNPALTMWKLVMERVHEGLPDKDFFELSNTVSASYCLDSGLVPTENCRLDPRGSRVATGVFYKDDVPRSACNVHTLTNVCGESGQLATPYCPVESLRRVAFLNVQRNMPIAGVTVGDEGYTVRIFGQDNQAPSGYFSAVVPVAEGAVAPNSFCALHPDAASVLPSPTPPFDPNNPFDGLPFDPFDLLSPSPTPPPDVPTVPPGDVTVSPAA